MLIPSKIGIAKGELSAPAHVKQAYSPLNGSYPALNSEFPKQGPL